MLKKIQDQDKTIAGDLADDVADHKALDAAHKDILEQQTKMAQLTKDLDGKSASLGQAQTQIKVLLQQTSDLKLTNATLQGDLASESEQNRNLRKESDELKSQVTKMTKDLASMQKTLSRTQQDLDQAVKDDNDKEQIIDDLEHGIQGLQKDRDAKKRALGALQESSQHEIDQLQAALVDMRAHDTKDHEKLDKSAADLRSSVDRATLDEAEIEKLRQEIGGLKAHNEPPEKNVDNDALVSFHTSSVSVPCRFGGAEMMSDVWLAPLVDGSLGKWMGVSYMLAASLKFHAIYSKVTHKLYIAPSSGVYPPMGINDSVEIRGTMPILFGSPLLRLTLVTPFLPFTKIHS